MRDYPAPFYDALHTGSPGDLAYYQRVCPPQSQVLELGCGSGRVLEALHPQSARCVGVDLHPGLLAHARKRLGAKAKLVQGDMLALGEHQLGPAFDRILLPFCGIYCVGGVAQLPALFASVRDHLTPDGHFIVDAYSAELFHLDDDESSDEQEPHEHPPIEVQGVSYRVFEQSRWDRSAQRILVSYLHAATDPDKALAAGLPDELVAELEHHYLLKAQLESAAQDAGLELTAAHAGFDDEPWHPEASWSVFRFTHAPGA